MLQKKYQVFVSSTYKDLKDERQDVIRSVLDLSHIPSSMEAFPATDQEQFAYIKKVIDECDYYVLIIGGRYGSLDSNGISYTEREYYYAVSEGLEVLAFLYQDISNLPVSNVDTDAVISARLNAFRDTVSKNRLVSFWESRADLRSKVVIALSKAFNDQPKIGWVRGDTAASEDLLRQNNKLRNDLDELKLKYSALQSELLPKVDGIATLDDVYKVEFRHTTNVNGREKIVNSSIISTWQTIFCVIGPNMFRPVAPGVIERSLADLVKQHLSHKNVHVLLSCVNVVKVHLSALGFFHIATAEAVGGGVQEFVSLTALGRKRLTELVAVRPVSLDEFRLDR